MKKVYLCVAPDGSLELWWLEKYRVKSPTMIMKLYCPPEFWGREVIDEWSE